MCMISPSTPSKIHTHTHMHPGTIPHLAWLMRCLSLSHSAATITCKSDVCVPVCVSISADTDTHSLCLHCTYILAVVGTRAVFFFLACGEFRSVHWVRVSPPNEIISKSRAHLAPTSQYSLSSLLVLNEVV